VERTFKPTDKFPKAHIERKNMQYLYEDSGLFYFMDTENYEQIPLTKEQLGDSLKFVKENDVVLILSYKGNIFGVEPPNFVELEVVATEPGVRGDTATNVQKPAKLETGAEIMVPIFINE
ncbi:elongation factor P, partial [Treponema sp. R6D11]